VSQTFITACIPCDESNLPRKEVSYRSTLLDLGMVIKKKLLSKRFYKETPSFRFYGLQEPENPKEVLMFLRK
jgi:hypothetical protein